MHWDDVNARARGLATHLLDREALAGLAAAPDWPALLGRLAALGYPVDDGTSGFVDPQALDRAVTRLAMDRLTLLGRWLAKRRSVLAVVLEDEDRRTVRALLRGVAQGASPGARLRALLPTPALPARALERLVRATTMPDLVHELVRLGHPAGRALQERLATAPTPVLRDFEWTLARLFCTRAVRAARPGGPVVRRFAAELVDEENVWTLLLAAPQLPGAASDAEYLPGGALLAAPRFAALRAERDSDRLLAALRTLFAGSALGGVLDRDPLTWPSLEAQAASARIAWLRSVARRDPLGPAVVLAVLERIRAEARALRAIAWGVSLGAPAPTFALQLPGTP